MGKRMPRLPVARLNRQVHYSAHGQSHEEVSVLTKADTPKTETASRRFWFSLLVAFSILDIALLALLVRMSVTLFGVRQDREAGGSLSQDLLEDSPFCLPCSQVYLTELEVEQNHFQVQQKMDEKNETRLCCGNSHDDLRTLIGKMYIRVQYTRDRAGGEIVMTNSTSESGDQDFGLLPYLQLSQDLTTPPTEVNGTHKVPLKQKWEAATEYNSTSAIFHGGSVNVRHSGHFYIYSQVPFKFAASPSVRAHTQYVYRVRNGGDHLLLENSVYPCVVSTENCLHSFVAGIFALKEGDEISLRVSDHSCIEREREMEFGIHLI